MIRSNTLSPRRFLSCVAASLACFLPFGAQAQDWFVGGGVGRATQQDYSIGGPVSSFDDSDTSAFVFGGYTIGANQAVVASYMDLGETRFEGPAFGGFSDEIDVDGYNVAYLARFMPGEQQRIAIFGTIGIFAWDQEVRFTDGLGTLLFTEEGTSFSFGLGASANLSADGTSPLSVFLSLQNLKDVGDEANSGHEDDREVVSVGISYRFGPRN